VGSSGALTIGVVEKSIVVQETQYTSAGSAHAFHKAFCANKSRCLEAVAVAFFDGAHFTGWDTVGALGGSFGGRIDHVLELAEGANEYRGLSHIIRPSNVIFHVSVSQE
jgi:hypothetical protein